MRRIGRLAYAILDAALVPIDRARRQKTVNRHHAKIRAVGERAVATLKGRKVPVKLSYCPRRVTAIVRAILVLLHVQAHDEWARCYADGSQAMSWSKTRRSPSSSSFGESSCMRP